MNEVPGRVESVGWLTAMSLIVAFAIPWFLWGSDGLVAGLPLWLWWHVGWLLLASLLFWAFTRRAWGLGITADGGIRNDGGEKS